jgi:hypothetical protein
MEVKMIIDDLQFGIIEFRIEDVSAVPEPFAALAAKAEIKLGPRSNDDSFEEQIAFTLSPESNEISPSTESVMLKIGTFSTIIPIGSFQEKKKGQFTFEGTIDNVELEVQFSPEGGSQFELKAEAKGADLTGTINPAMLILTIGDDIGTISVNAEFSK